MRFGVYPILYGSMLYFKNNPNKITVDIFKQKNQNLKGTKHEITKIEAVASENHQIPKQNSNR